MRTIGIPQLYCGASGQKGAYNRQEVGLARALCLAGLPRRGHLSRPDPLRPTGGGPGTDGPGVVPARPGAGRPRLLQKLAAASGRENRRRPCDGRQLSGGAGSLPVLQTARHLFLQPAGRPEKRQQLGQPPALSWTFCCGRNLAVYRKTPAFAKTPAAAAELKSLGVPCAGVLPVGLDTAIIPMIPGSRRGHPRRAGNWTPTPGTCCLWAALTPTSGRWRWCR